MKQRGMSNPRYYKSSLDKTCVISHLFQPITNQSAALSHGIGYCVWQRSQYPISFYVVPESGSRYVQPGGIALSRSAICPCR